MKDTHLIIALYRALDRFGSSSVPDDEGPRDARPVPHAGERRRRPGWVSVAEVEASQSPNTIPRLTHDAIRTRCLTLSAEQGSPVHGITETPERCTWVLVAPPGDASGGGRSDRPDASRREGQEGRPARGDDVEGAARAYATCAR